MKSRCIGIKDVSVYLGVNVRTIYSWISQRKIPHIKVGRLVRFDPKKIDEWLEENTNNAHSVY